MEKTAIRKPRKAKLSAESALLIKAAKKAAKNAIRTSKALGLDITYIKKGVIYKESPDGDVIIVGNHKQAFPNRVNLKKAKNILWSQRFGKINAFR